MITRNWKKEDFLKTSSFYWQTCTLHAGVKLDIFSHLAAGPADAASLSKKLACDKRNLALLLNALTAMELLLHHGDRYENSPAAARYLVKDSPEYIGFILMHHHYLLDSWQKIDQAVETGRPVRQRSSHGGAAERESFLMGMFNLAMSTAPVVAEKLDLSSSSLLLDLGGGPGTYAVHFCLANPQLKAEVFDLPSSENFARQTIERFALADRITFRGGDFLEAGLSLEKKYDAAWLSHILHGEGPAAAEAIIEKAVAALTPGGKIFIHEFILNSSHDGPLFPALFSLNMMVGTPGGQTYSEEQLVAMLTRQGVSKIERIDFTGPSQSGILAGRV